jgi:hypothetical protein
MSCAALVVALLLPLVTESKWALADVLDVGDLEEVELPSADRQPDINFTYAHGPFSFTLPDDAKQRSVVNLGQSERFRAFLRKLAAGVPVRVVVFGGSVTCGNGLHEQFKLGMRFSGAFQAWLQKSFPVTQPLSGPNVDPEYAGQHMVENK